MVNDLRGEAVSVGAGYHVAGDAVAISGDRVMLSVGQRPLEVDGTQVLRSGRIVDAAPGVVDVVRGLVAQAGATTFEYLRRETGGLAISEAAGVPLTLARKCKIGRYNANSWHTHGSDPGDWTLGVVVWTPAGGLRGAVTGTVGLSASGAKELTSGQTANVNAEEGDTLELYVWGPSCTGLWVSLALEFLYRP